MNLRVYICFFVLISLSAGFTFSQDELTTAREGIITRLGFQASPQGVDGIIHSSGLILPSYKQGYFFTSDYIWPGWANCAQRVIFDGALDEIFKEGNKPIPSIDSSFVREGIMLLLHLTDYRYMCIFPLTSSSAMSWLFSERDGSFTLKTRTLVIWIESGTLESNGNRFRKSGERVLEIPTAALLQDVCSR